MKDKEVVSMEEVITRFSLRGAEGLAQAIKDAGYIHKSEIKYPAEKKNANINGRAAGYNKAIADFKRLNGG